MKAAKAPVWLWFLGLVAIALAQEKPEGALATTNGGAPPLIMTGSGAFFLNKNGSSFLDPDNFLSFALATHFATLGRHSD